VNHMKKHALALLVMTFMFSLNKGYFTVHAGDPRPCRMAPIPAGTFQMGDSFGEGDPDELPVHPVTLDSFHISSTETTNGQYCGFLNQAEDNGWITVTGGVVYKAGSGPNHPYCNTTASSSHSPISYTGGVFSVKAKGGRDMSNDPVSQVSWYGAVAYCNWLSWQEDRRPCYNLSTWKCDFSKNGYHLPTAAQWEYAARGGLSRRRFPWGDSINHDHANYRANGSAYKYDTSPYTAWTFHPDWNDGTYPYTCPVGSMPPNGYGLYGMTGNVWEWCNDWYDWAYYASSPPKNPTGPDSGTYRVLRGGSWSNNAGSCRVADPTYGRPGYRSYYGGFRVSLD